MSWHSPATANLPTERHAVSTSTIPPDAQADAQECMAAMGKLFEREVPCTGLKGPRTVHYSMGRLCQP
jgi:hypothetical protein